MFFDTEFLKFVENTCELEFFWTKLKEYYKDRVPLINDMHLMP